MRTKALLLSAGVAAALVAAVFVGAAAANTGAPGVLRRQVSGARDHRIRGVRGRRGGGRAAAAGRSRRRARRRRVADDDPRCHAASVDSAVTDAAGRCPEGHAPADPAPTPAPAPDLRPPLTGQPEAPGGPPRSPTPGAPAPSAEEQQAWLAFQQLVRECMADAGQEYLAWEWWNPAPDTSNRFPPMPADLTPEQYAAWKLALDGDAGTDADYRWQDAGCWGHAVHVTGATD